MLIAAGRPSAGALTAAALVSGLLLASSAAEAARSITCQPGFHGCRAGKARLACCPDRGPRPPVVAAKPAPVVCTVRFQRNCIPPRGGVGGFPRWDDPRFRR